jgi:hypothetical protein
MRKRSQPNEKNIIQIKTFADSMIEKGWQHAQRFTPQKSAESIMMFINLCGEHSPAF